MPYAYSLAFSSSWRVKTRAAVLN